MRPLARESCIAFAMRSGEAERLALLGPGERQGVVSDELLCGEAAWLAALEERAGDIRSEKGQAQQQRHIGRAELLLHRQVGDTSAWAGAELLLQAMRTNEQLNQLGIRCAGDPRPDGRIDDETLALADAAEPRRKRQQQRVLVLRDGRSRCSRLPPEERV